MDNSSHELRKLAKTYKYQNLLDASKAMSGIHMFRNMSDFTCIQLGFLRWVSFYYNLGMEVRSNEVSDWVLKDDIYADAYCVWKSKKNKNEVDKQKLEKPGDLRISFGNKIKEAK